MMFLHTLRLAGDLSFYYAFAGFFAASFGGTPMPLVLVWPALCFGLASCFEGSRPLRTTLAALSAAALLFLPTGADKLCCFPAACWRRCAQGRSCSAAVLWLPVQRRLRLPFTLAGSCRCCSCF